MAVFVLQPEVIDLVKDDSSSWETEPMELLAAQGQLMAYEHAGFWQPMDTLREKPARRNVANLNGPVETVDVNQPINLQQVFAGKRVFLTGHTGFKGAWLCLLLNKLGAQVYGYALPPATQPSLFMLAGVADTLAGHHLADVRNEAALACAMQAARPDLVLHLAAQALVRQSYADPPQPGPPTSWERSTCSRRCVSARQSGQPWW